MRVNIKRIDPSLPLPEYHSPGAVAFDMYARETTSVAPGVITRIPANLVVETPKGYMLMVKDRSSTAKRKGIFVLVGYVDQDYCGEEDELTIQVYNFTKEPVAIERGDRIAQGAFVKIDIAEWKEMEKMGEKNRGGFGSTG